MQQPCTRQPRLQKPEPCHANAFFHIFDYLALQHYGLAGFVGQVKVCARIIFPTLTKFNFFVKISIFFNGTTAFDPLVRLNPQPSFSSLQALEYVMDRLNVFDPALTENQDFWNASGSNGSWRLIATWRHGQNPGLDSERATVLTWDNATAQSLACHMLGMDDKRELPWIFSAARCARALCLEAALWTSEQFEFATFTEAPTGHREAESAGDSHTNRLLVFNENELCSLAAGFELAAAATGGQALHSHLDLKLAARALACKSTIHTPFHPRTALHFKPASSHVADQDVFGLALDSGRLAHFDMPSAALALGSGERAAFAVPARAGWSGPFLDAMSAKRFARTRMPEALSLGAHVELNHDCSAKTAQGLLSELRQAVFLKAELHQHVEPSTSRKPRGL